jgi:hypothetical protein
VPYLLLAVPTLGIGLGIGLGLSQAPATKPTIADTVQMRSATTTTASVGAPSSACAAAPASGITCVSLSGKSWFNQISVTNDGLLLNGQVASTAGAPEPCVSTMVEPQTLQLEGTTQASCDDPAISGQSVTAVNANVPESNNATIAISVLDSETEQVSVGPVVMTYGSYSDTRPVLAYGGGWFWIYDDETTNGAELLQVSESSGQVVDTVPMPILYKPILAANVDGAWIGNSDEGGECAGCGPPSALYHVSPGSAGANVVVPDPTLLVCWLVGDGSDLWVGMGEQDDGCTQQTIWRFDRDDPEPVFQVPDTRYDPAVVVGNETDGLWSVVSLPNAAQVAVRIDPDTGKQTLVATLPPISMPTYDEGLNAGQAAYFDGSLFVLEPPFQANGYLGYSQLLRVSVPS